MVSIKWGVRTEQPLGSKQLNLDSWLFKDFGGLLHDNQWELQIVIGFLFFK